MGVAHFSSGMSVILKKKKMYTQTTPHPMLLLWSPSDQIVYGGNSGREEFGL